MANTYDDPWENFKAAGSPGGKGGFDPNAWQKQMAQPAAPAAAPAAPKPVAQQPASAPQAQPSYNQFQSPSYGAAPQWQQQQQAQAPQPQAGGHPLDKAFAVQAGNTDYRDTTSGMYSPEQWKAWEEEERGRYGQGQSANQRGDCPPNKPFTGRGGQCAEKPDDCPDGTHVEGSDTNGTAKCVPDGGGRGGAGGGQGGQGAQGGGQGGQGGYGNYGVNSPIFDYLKSSGLQAAQDPESALKSFMGYGGAAEFQAQQDQLRQQVEQMPPGPARDAAVARLEESKGTQLAKMRQAASSAARADLQGNVQPELGYNQLGENARQANQTNQLGWGNLDVNKMLGLGQLALGNRQQDFTQDYGWAGLDQSNQQFAQNLGLQRYGLEGGWANNLDTQAAQNAAGQPTGTQKTLGTLSSLAGTAKSVYDMYKDWKGQG